VVAEGQDPYPAIDQEGDQGEKLGLPIPEELAEIQPGERFYSYHREKFDEDTQKAGYKTKKPPQVCAGSI
jgi:hypothetical protein